MLCPSTRPGDFRPIRRNVLHRFNLSAERWSHSTRKEVKGDSHQIWRIRSGEPSAAEPQPHDCTRGAEGATHSLVPGKRGWPPMSCHPSSPSNRPRWWRHDPGTNERHSRSGWKAWPTSLPGWWFSSSSTTSHSWPR